MATATDDLEAKLLRIATECQQNYYEILSDWNRYESNEHDYLKDFIGYALFGAPNYKPENSDERDNSHFSYDEKQCEAIKLVFTRVIEYGQGNNSDGIVLCGIVYNVIYKKEHPFNPKNNKKKEEKEPEKKSKDEPEEKSKDVPEKISKDEPEEKSKNELVKKLKNEPEPSGDEALKSEPRVYPVPLFKVRSYRCANMIKEKKVAKESDAENIYYIDNVGRVYDGFLKYLQNNKLPQCTMVVPKDGRYQADPASLKNTDFEKQNINDFVSKVWIDVHQSPASNVASKVLLGGDIASTVVTLASMGVGIAAMVTPIGAGVVAASALGAGVSGLWSVGRSAQQLADRGQHGESINVTDREALGAWIGIAGGTLGMAATGGQMLLARAVRTGTTVGRAAMVAHDAVLIGNLIVNGVGVGYKSWDMLLTYKESGEVSMSDVFFLTTHIFFFCNSVVNVRLAQNFIETSQGQLLKDYEDSLRSNRHRKEFQRMARNTRIAGTNDVSSNEEIIRGINKIGNKDEFFQAMVRNRKAFSAAGAKASFADGKVTVNSVMTIDPIEFANLPKEVRVDIVKGVSSVQPSSSAPVKPANFKNEVSWKNFDASNKNALKDFCSRHSSALLQTACVKVGDFDNVLFDLHKVKNSTEIFIKLLDIAYKILQAMPREETTIGNIFSTIVQFLWDYVKGNLRYGNPGVRLEDPSAQLLLDKLIAELFHRVEKHIEVWVQAFREWLENQFRQKIGGF